MKSIQEVRVLIAGAGAVGGTIAARLIEKGIDTTLLTRPERREQIVCRALHLVSAHGRFRKPVPAVVAGEITSRYDLIILACRAHFLQEAVTQIEPGVGPHTAILSLLDGGPNLGVLRRVFPSNPVLEGVLEGRLRIDADGIISHAPPEVRIHIGKRHARDSAAASIAELLSGRGLTASTHPKIEQLAFARSIYLAAGIGATILTGRPLRDALRRNTGAILFGYMLSEGRDIALAEDVTIDKALTHRYRTALSLDGEPVMVPPRISDPRGAGPEAFYLLARMVDRAERYHIRAHSLRGAMATLADNSRVEVADVQ